MTVRLRPDLLGAVPFAAGKRHHGIRGAVQVGRTLALVLIARTAIRVTPLERRVRISWTRSWLDPVWQVEPVARTASAVVGLD